MPKNNASDDQTSPVRTSVVDVDNVVDGQPRKSDANSTRKSAAGAALDTSTSVSENRVVFNGRYMLVALVQNIVCQLEFSL